MKNEIVTSSLYKNNDKIFKYEFLSNYIVIKNDDKYVPTFQQVLGFIDKIGYTSKYFTKSDNFKELLKIKMKELLTSKINPPFVKVFCKADNLLYYLNEDTNIIYDNNILEEKGKIIIKEMEKEENEKTIVEKIMELKRLNKNKINKNNNSNNKNIIDNPQKNTKIIKIKNKKETEEEKLIKKIHNLEIENEHLKKENFNLKKQIINKNKINKNPIKIINKNKIKENK